MSPYGDNKNAFNTFEFFRSQVSLGGHLCSPTHSFMTWKKTSRHHFLVQSYMLFYKVWFISFCSKAIEMAISDLLFEVFVSESGFKADRRNKTDHCVNEHEKLSKEIVSGVVCILFHGHFSFWKDSCSCVFFWIIGCHGLDVEMECLRREIMRIPRFLMC